VLALSCAGLVCLALAAIRFGRGPRRTGT